MDLREFKKQLVPRPLGLKAPAFLREPSIRKELEIGAGDGEFAFNRALARPDTQFIAIEKSRTLFRLLQKRQKTRPLPNLWIFHTNAVWWISHFVQKNSLNNIYILYPNIYIKARQSNLRWFNRSFMSYLTACLKKGGRLEVRTNENSYYEECKVKMKQFCNMQSIKDLRLLPPPCTAFERKSMAQGRVCRLLLYEKRSASRPIFS